MNGQFRDFGNRVNNSVGYKTILNKLLTPFNLISIIAVIVILWMASGLFEKQVVINEEVTKPVKVQVEDSNARPTKIAYKYNGVTKANNNIIIRPEIDGIVTDVLVKDGDFIRKGETLVKLEQENRQALIKQAKVGLENAKLQYDAAKIIFDKKLSSRSNFVQMEADLSKAEADLEQAINNLNKTYIKAPYDGYIEVLEVKKGDYVSNLLGSVVGKFSSLNPLLVAINVTSSDLKNLNNSMRAKIISGNKITDGQIIFIGKVADPDTRTFPVEIIFDNGNQLFKIGESVSVELISDRDDDLHYIPKSSLILDDEGKISVKVLQNNDEVLTKNIEIKNEDENGFWINGLNEFERLIVLGASNVIDGEKVTVE